MDLLADMELYGVDFDDYDTIIRKVGDSGEIGEGDMGVGASVAPATNLTPYYFLSMRFKRMVLLHNVNYKCLDDE